MLALSPSAKSQTAYNGYLDYVGCGSISGWDLDWNRLTTSIGVSLYNNSSIFASPSQPVIASNYRPDLATGGDASTQYHGFVIGTPTFLLDGQTHQINATYDSTSTNLNNSPMSFACHAYNGYLDTANFDTISGWALDWYNIENPITVDIYDNGNLILAGVLANIYRGDLATGGDYNSKVHGFSITTPASLLDGGVHMISVQYGGSTSALQNSFQQIGGSGGPMSGPAIYSLSSLWQWNPLYYTSTTSVGSTIVANAINAWKSVQSSFMIPYGVNPTPGHANAADITIADDSSLPPGTYGVTTYNGDINPAALGHPSVCGVCYTNSVRVLAAISLSPINIANRVDTVNSFLGTAIPYSTGWQLILAHELGHALNLDTSINYVSVSSCSAVQTIMYTGLTTMLRCGIMTPTAGDGVMVNQLYGSNPTSTSCGDYSFYTGVTCP